MQNLPNGLTSLPVDISPEELEDIKKWYPSERRADANADVDVPELMTE